LEAEIATVDGQTRRDIAVNDVYLERSTGQTARLRLTIDGHPVVESLVADGVILATALGSTAYSFSAGGAPAHPEVPILCVTPICPHLPKLSPFILPIDAVARAEVLVPDRRPVRAVADGRAVEAVAAVTVRRAAQPVRIAWFAGHDPTSTLVHKIVSG
jgi:NAD+ kinase